MKIKSIFHVSVFLMVFLVFSMPFVSFAQWNQVQEQAMSEAKRDAQASVDKQLWFWAGCFGGFFGVFGANTYHHPIPTVPLLGKSPEYVAFYTDTYIVETRDIQSDMAALGCGVGVGIPIFLSMCMSVGIIPTPKILR